jgi:hypothetical protein
MNATAPASIDGSMTSWNCAPNGTMCWAPTRLPSGSTIRPSASGGALPAVASRSAGMLISGTSNSDALSRTAAGLDCSKAATSASSASTGAEKGTGKQSSALVSPSGPMTSSDQSVGSQRVTVIGSSRTSSSAMLRNRSAIQPSAHSSAG